MPALGPWIREEQIKDVNRLRRKQVTNSVSGLESEDAYIRKLRRFARGGADTADQPFNSEKIVSGSLTSQETKEGTVTAAEIHLQGRGPVEDLTRIEAVHIRFGDEFDHKLKWTRRGVPQWPQILPVATALCCRVWRSGAILGTKTLERCLNLNMKPLVRSISVLALCINGCFAVSAAENTTPAATKTAVFAGGCFWCIQPAFDKAPGVVKTLVGYCGGTEPNPTYDLVTSETTKYRESIQITYDPGKVSFAQLLDIYWKQINPTQSDGQFTDIGPSYRAAIFVENDEEKKIAEASKEKLAHSGKFDRPIVTEILPALKFYPAEDYHQKYYKQNPVHFEAFEKGSGRVSFEKKTWGDGH
jgi:methionine-S-sulfoxide reductase